MAKTGDIRAVAFGGGSILLVGASFPVTGLLQGYPVLAGQAVRYAIGGLILLGVLLARGRRLPLPGLRDLAGILGMVVAGMLGFNAAILVAERYATPGFVTAVVGCTPLVLAIAVPLLGRRRPAMAAVLGAGIVVGGVAVLTGGGSWHGPGLLLALACMAGEVLFTLCGIGPVQRLGAMEASTWASFIAAIGGAGIASIVDGGAAWRLPTPTEGTALVVLGVFVTAVAFTGWYTCVARIGADRAGVLVGLMPVSGLVVSVLLHAQALTVTAAVGASAVAAGCTLGLYRRRVSARREPSEARPMPHPAARR
ncbi:DMT family transporter [Kutzneria kofuensis]|uniref:Drug/metabolite transporter (DMT)-like permease n=1 Tax=Kutzneria kofuensis TaxID=103725 RepID=A0A7W9NGI0_9PSEU|nr:DMT family transporter [Kutzneria kofuensis]MBB5891725.1 drug/metabolite transporter (DMT)-like permease [Kutzneria kofuensis]